jgi:putative FmdB family regulatory protein
MPIYEYEARDPQQACARCARPFEHLHRTNAAPLTACPACGGPVIKLLSVAAVGGSKSGFDDRARRAGFSKLTRLGKGEYERKY